jgi:hypothetical protein
VTAQQNSSCSQAALAVERALHLGTLDSLSVDLLGHISSCERCRAALLSLAQTLGLSPSPAFPGLDCAACQSDLAAYIEAERASPAAAALRFPALWWHLWACPVCAETYRLTQLLMDEAARDNLPPLPGC